MGFEHAWLNYTRLKDDRAAAYFTALYTNDGDAVTATAIKELQLAANAFFGQIPARCADPAQAGVSLLRQPDHPAGAEGYRITEAQGKITIASAGASGLLYGAFALIRRLQTGKPLAGLDEQHTPANPLRMLNHWDNMDGSIERGYAGNSFFFEEETVVVNDRTRAYARLAASVGINASVINNVNVKGNATRLIDEAYAAPLRQMAAIFAEYGIRLYLSLNFAAPMELGGPDSADPLDPQVAAWWQAQMKKTFANIPGLGGFLVKADSEGRPGPFTYGRTHADGANMLADAAAPYGGRIIWRCFVYNCQQDWRDRKTDRARSGYDNFMQLDGKFRDNVILQIKNGPMDFQVREPVHPLLGGLEHTNSMLEVQIAQEYTGQQRHVCYLIPMFKEVLGFKTGCAPQNDTVADIVSGRTFAQSSCGMAAVANTGNDDNWTGHDLAAANLYGFGRLAFDTTLDAQVIAAEWAACTFGNQPAVTETVVRMLMLSWPAYENYTAPLGIGWMVNPNHHYGPNVDGYEYDRWGTYHRADHLGLGVDRTANGTGYAQQYRPANAAMYEDVQTCPEELVLFFHHLPYTHRLHSGKTVIQHIYDTHFAGAEQAKELLALWQSVQGSVPETVFERTAQRLRHQCSHAEEWRDQINTYFYRKSMIPDEKGRVIY